MTHKVCGYTWEVTPDNFMRRHSRCPLCKGNPRYTTEQFKEHMKSAIGAEHVFHGEYVNARTKMLCEHTVCGNKWWVKPYALKQGVICPSCAESSGERATRLALDSLGISYTTQATFEGCHTKRLLPFDFFLQEHNVAIEYDGIQHYVPVDFGGKGKRHAEKAFSELVARDKIKEDYCDSVGISLIRIPYMLPLDSIESFIDSKLTKLYSK